MMVPEMYNIIRDGNNILSYYQTTKELQRMSLASGLKKLFGKRDRFAPPNEFRLNHKEKESVIVFFSLLGCIIIIFTLLIALY
jgi:hypothetical protein